MKQAQYPVFKDPVQLLRVLNTCPQPLVSKDRRFRLSLPKSEWIKMVMMGTQGLKLNLLSQVAL